MKKCCPKLPIAFLLVFILGAFFYYQYSFTALSKVDFREDTFYSYKDGVVDLFAPGALEYQLCFYNSYMPESRTFFGQSFKDNAQKILAIDFYQQGKGELAGDFGENFIEMRIPTNLMLKLIHTFSLKTLPRCFLIKQDKKNNAQYAYLKEFGFYQLINFKEK